MPEATGRDAIRLDSVGVLRGEKWLIRDISWAVAANTTAAVLGPNGCGKSTLLRIIGGQIYPTEGSARVAGVTFGRGDFRQLRRRVQLVTPPGAAENPYEPRPSMPVLDVVCSGLDGTAVFNREPSASEKEQARAALADAGAQSLERQAYGTLSTGERTRVQLARALVSRPEVLLLDEPAHGLDIPGREGLLRTLADLHGRLTLVIVTHHPEELPAPTEHVLLLSGGRASAEGEPRTVLTSATVTDAYGVDLDVHHVNGRVQVHVRTGR